MGRALSHADAAKLGDALIRLRGETLADLTEATGIRGANISVWRRGKEQVISEARVTLLLEHLGVREGRLHGDTMHQWHIAGDFSDVHTVLSLLLPGEYYEASTIYRSKADSFQSQALLRIQTKIWQACIHLSIKPGLAMPIAVCINALGIHQNDLPDSALKALATGDIEKVTKALATAAKRETKTPSILEALPSLLQNEPSAAHDIEGLTRLVTELKRALQVGMSADEIALVVATRREELITSKAS